MPSYTLGEIMSHATARVGRRSDLTTSDVSFWVNVAYAEVRDAAPPSQAEEIATLALQDGENRYLLPTDFAEPISVILQQEGGNSALARTDATDLDLRGASSGAPTHYAFFNEWVELWPTPVSGSTLQLRYRTASSDLSETTDIPSLSTPWRHAVLLRTETLLHELLGNYPAAASSQGRYLSYISQLDTDQARRQKAREKIGIQVLY